MERGETSVSLGWLPQFDGSGIDRVRQRSACWPFEHEHDERFASTDLDC